MISQATIVPNNVDTQAEYFSGFKLTAREVEIIQLLAEGYSTKEIAINLNLSFHTIESYRKGLLAKMKARNMVHLIAKASKLNFFNSNLI